MDWNALTEDELLFFYGFGERCAYPSDTTTVFIPDGSKEWRENKVYIPKVGFRYRCIQQGCARERCNKGKRILCAKHYYSKSSN